MTDALGELADRRHVILESDGSARDVWGINREQLLRIGHRGRPKTKLHATNVINGNGELPTPYASFSTADSC